MSKRELDRDAATEDLLARSDEIDEKLAETDIGAAVLGLAQYGQRNRQMIRRQRVISVVLGIVVLALVASGVFLKGVAVRADRTAASARASADQVAALIEEARANAQNITQACKDRNEDKAGEFAKLIAIIFEPKKCPKPVQVP